MPSKKRKTTAKKVRPAAKKGRPTAKRRKSAAKKGKTAAKTRKPAAGKHKSVAKERTRATAQSMAAQQREISVSEFFTKNRHLLGFDSPTKALLTTLKEAVDRPDVSLVPYISKTGHPRCKKWKIIENTDFESDL